MENNEIELNIELGESIQSFLIQINQLTTLHSENKKNYTGLSKKLINIFNNLTDNEVKDIRDVDLIDQARTISTTNNKIRSSIYSIKNTFLSLNSNQISINFEKSLRTKFSAINSDVTIIARIINDIENEVKTLNDQNLYLFSINSHNDIKDSSKNSSLLVDISNWTKSNQKIQHKNLLIKKVLNLNNEIYKTTILLLDIFSKIKIELLDLKNKISEEKNFDYIERFKEDTDLILKKYELRINSLTSKLENRIDNIDLNYTELLNNNDSLKSGLETSLTNLERLDNGINNIEFEFTKILNTQTEKVQTDLNESKENLMEAVENIKTEANTKLNEINTAHSDFKNLVVNAGIYELTKNYKVKADEEKIEYQTYRKFTTWSIMAAIGSTLLIFVIAFLEHYFSSNNNDQTNYLLLASRLSISVMFFVLAFYLSKQASKHYECYQENHRTFLQLASLEPFMERMTPEEKKEIRKELIPNYFNQGPDGKFAAKGDEVDLPSNINSIVNRVFDLVGEKKDTKTGENTVAESKPQG